MVRRLIINADDFGLEKGINEAVQNCHKHGVVTSVSLMVNMPAASKAVRIAKALPKLGVGAHLNLTEGKPVSQDALVEPLVDSEGEFRYSPFTLAVLSACFHRIRRAIRAELAEQVQWLVDKGITPTHLDSHKHIHCLPAIWSIVGGIANDFSIGAVRYCYEPKELSASPWPLSGAVARKKARLLRPMARMNRFQNKALTKADALFGISHMGKIDHNFFKAISLYNPVEIAEVMTHPAVDDDSRPGEISGRPNRKAEYEALCDERTKRYLAEANVKLIHYGQI